MSTSILTWLANPLSIDAMAPRKTARKTPDIDQLLKERLRELGARGGKAAAGKLSKAERAAKAKKAATARWGQKQDQPLKLHGDPLDAPKGKRSRNP
jgi:hypothetical protein